MIWMYTKKVDMYGKISDKKKEEGASLMTKKNNPAKYRQ